MHFELLRELEKEFEFEYFKLGEENFESIRDFASAKLPLPDKKLDPIGAIASKPSNYKTWEIFAKRLGEEKRDKALSELKEIREYYGY